MRVLLVRPPSPNERFGLGPFFRVEPLGLEYVAAALLREGHRVRIADLRFGPSLHARLRQFRPELVGIACTHTVDVPTTLLTASEVKRRTPEAFTLVGGHAAGAFPEPLLTQDVDAVCVTDGELTFPALVRALSSRAPLGDVPGLWVRHAPGAGAACFRATARQEQRISLDEVALPARELVAPFQHHYRCVHMTPLWAVETSRGCPFRCSFCSIWRWQGRSFRHRSVDAVATDLATAGPNVFIVDDLFWHPRARSLQLAQELRRRHVRKSFILVQARLDTVARNADLLAAWRPLADVFDIFFGFEVPTDQQLARLSKDMTVAHAEAGIEVARSLGYGVTGNFVVDPDFTESDFESMWAMVDRLALRRCGFTVLTPLPGTPLFEAMQPRLVERDFSRYDMHHILYEPRLGRQRFFELFAESWRRNVLSRDHSRTSWLRWFRGLGPRQALALARVLHHTQRMLRPEAYLAESFPLQLPAHVGKD